MKILLIRLRLIGDVVFTTPAVAAVRARFPDARLTYLVEPAAEPVIRHNPHVNEVIVIERPRGLARLVAEVESVDAVGLGQYATVTRLGVREGIPMLTLTNPDLAAVEPSSPSAPYLGWICSGLHEAHGWAAERIAGYLSGAPGVRGSWRRDEIADLALERITAFNAAGRDVGV